MQMQPLDALWGTKFYTYQSHWPLLIVRLCSLLIRSSIFSKLLETGKNKTYVIPLPSLDPQPMLINLQDFLFYVAQPCILISPRTVSPQTVVINYQTSLRGLDDSQQGLLKQLTQFHSSFNYNQCHAIRGHNLLKDQPSKDKITHKGINLGLKIRWTTFAYTNYTSPLCMIIPKN
jgi:hypothetical protein